MNPEELRVWTINLLEDLADACDKGKPICNELGAKGDSEEHNFNMYVCYGSGDPSFFTERYT